MDIRLAVTILSVLLSQAQGHPRGAEEASVSNSEDTKKIVPVELSTTAEVKKMTSGVNEESPGKQKVPTTSLGTMLKARRLEDSKLLPTLTEVQDEAVRSARQSSPPTFHQTSFGKGPHMTTVCIQVRSDHNPQVICGPQYGEREDHSAAPAAARLAAPFDYVRAAPQGYAQGPSAPARGFPTRRTEEDLQPRPVDANYHPASGLGPQNSQAPSRVIPSSPPGSVYVHRQYYQPVFSGGPMSPTQALMRLNCAVEPSGQLLSPQLVRGGALGYQDQSPNEAVFTLSDGSSAKFGANIVSPNPIRTQSSFAVPQGQWARSSSDEDMAYLNSQMLGYSQNYPSGVWNNGAYPGESYPVDMMQGRSASGEDGGQDYLGYPAAYPGLAPASDDYARREYLQLQALRESKEKLRDIQEQLTAFREREELQKLSSKNSSNSETSKDSSGSGISIDIKATPTKTTKRQTRN